MFCSFIQVFAFDYCFWSMDESNTTKYAGKLALSLHLAVRPLASSSVMSVFFNYSGALFFP